MNPFLLTDGYKTAHHKMYPKGTSLVFDNFTPRSSKYATVQKDAIVVFGSTLAWTQIINLFEEYFFKTNQEEVIEEIETIYSAYLGSPFDASHIRRLHTFGYLPINVRALPEGTLCPIGVPVMTLWNTESDFYWLPNFLETLISNLLWKPMTSATIAYGYKKILTKWALKTDKENLAFVDFQGHDFSMRGLDSAAATISSGMGHATSFSGSDSLPVIYGIREFYNTQEPMVFSIPATEHSVMCAGTKEDEVGTMRMLMKEFPTGPLGIVSDTWDLWKLITEHLVTLKDEIMARDGKIVIRPDSGDPVDIICGTGLRPIPYSVVGEDRLKEDGPNGEVYLHPRCKGVIELLWDIFGGTTNAQGYKVLDSHIGAIYGDSITTDRAEEICERLEAKGFASTNIVLGIGSYTYQFNTRDTYGFAMKATYVEVEEERREIFKDPITDDGTKKSAKGLLSVEEDDEGKLVLNQGATWEVVNSFQNKHEMIVRNGNLIQTPGFRIIKDRIRANLNRELGIN